MEELKEYETVIIPISYGKEQEFAIMDEFDMDENHYIVVSPVKNDEIKDGYYLYKAEADEDGTLSISKIEDKEEMEKAAAIFTER